MKRILLSAAGLALLGACSSGNPLANPKAYETPEQDIFVQDHGIVSCQLYTRELVVWDRAVHWPQTLPQEVADEFCLREGQKWRDGADGDVYVVTPAGVTEVVARY